MTDFIRYEVDLNSHVASIILNRPEKRNALTEAMTNEIHAAFELVKADSAVRCVIVKAAGPTFCAGHDVTEWAERPPYALDGEFYVEQRQSLALMASWRKSIWEAPQPVIAQVHGACFTSGIHLAMNCDLVVVAEDARFEFRSGIGGAGQFITLLPWLVGLRKAKEICFLGSTISGKQAVDLGLANFAVPTDKLDAFTAKLATRVAANPLVFSALNKQAFNAVFELMGGRFALEYSGTMHAISHLSDESHRLAREVKGGDWRAAQAIRDEFFGVSEPAAETRGSDQG